MIFDLLGNAGIYNSSIYTPKQLSLKGVAQGPTSGSLVKTKSFILKLDHLA